MIQIKCSCEMYSILVLYILQLQTVNNTSFFWRNFSFLQNFGYLLCLLHFYILGIHMIEYFHKNSLQDTLMSGVPDRFWKFMLLSIFLKVRGISRSGFSWVCSRRHIDKFLSLVELRNIRNYFININCSLHVLKASNYEEKTALSLSNET